MCRRDIEDLITLHPNITVAPDFMLPQSWSFWWDWAGDISSAVVQDGESKWQILWRYYTDTAPSDDAFVHIPTYLRGLIREARHLQLCRQQGREAVAPGRVGHDCWLPSAEDIPSSSTNLHGMSPKKTHEVRLMSKYTGVILSRPAAHGINASHVVDVGAGQVSDIFGLSQGVYRTYTIMVVSARCTFLHDSWSLVKQLSMGTCVFKSSL